VFATDHPGIPLLATDHSGIPLLVGLDLVVTAVVRIRLLGVCTVCTATSPAHAHCVVVGMFVMVVSLDLSSLGSVIA
jgi:hypothetical protein